LIIDPQGAVRSSAIEESAGNQLLDDTACRLIFERFHYEPARGAGGAARWARAKAVISWRPPAQPN
jgi:outer membrane biosynthesis protein TonB